jgi:RND family efflux transporter MFP subunit
VLRIRHEGAHRLAHTRSTSASALKYSREVPHKLRWLALSAVASAGIVGVGWLLVSALTGEATSTAAAGPAGPVPVEVAEIREADMERRRVFTGTLEAAATFDVAAKVGGRIERITVDLADVVTRGQVIAELDDEEYDQAVAQARADVAVADAEKTAADNALQIAKRAFERVEGLHARSIAADQELDTVRAEKLEAEAAVAVTASRSSRARAALKAATIREEYTRVTADWSGDDEQRVVAARFADEGETVAANTPIVSIVDIDPVIVVVHVTEKDYAELKTGQPVSLDTDAYPGVTFQGRVSRIAPVFRVESRQARIELSVDNPDGRLKPGMFVRAHTVLDRVAEAKAVPQDALAERDGQTVVFVVNEAGTHVAQRVVQIGIKSEGWVQVTGDGLGGRVVTLGQQKLEDGSEVTVVTGDAP